MLVTLLAYQFECNGHICIGEEDPKRPVRVQNLNSELNMPKEQLYDVFQQVLQVKKFEHQLLHNALQVRYFKVFQYRDKIPWYHDKMLQWILKIFISKLYLCFTIYVFIYKLIVNIRAEKERIILSRTIAPISVFQFLDTKSNTI